MEVWKVDIEGEQWDIRDMILTEYVNLACPVGVIHAYFGTSAPNTNWLICDGSQFSQTDYPALYNLLGTNTLPDLRETVLVGIGERSEGVSDHDVYELGEFKDDQIQTHSHAYSTTGRQYGGWQNSNANGNWQTLQTQTTGTTGRFGTTTHGKQIGVNYIIRAR